MSKFRWLLAVIFAVATLPSGAEAQAPGTIRGQVIDQATGRALQSAQVSLVGTNRGTLTDENGRFAITGIAAGTYTVQVTYIGYKQASQQVTVGTEPVTVTIALETDILRLDELVVVGYGVEKRRNIAGAISSLQATETVREIPAPSIDNVLQGRLAGVQVTQNSGMPGSGLSVRVRGASSISAGNQPLYVIDGVPMTQGSFSSLDGTMGGQAIDAIADLNPADIESIEVLKDASAAAIYGSRASNGVVLITTKRGQAADRPKITFDMFAGTQKDWNRVEFLNTDEYIQVYNEGIYATYGIENYFGYTDDGVDNVEEIERGVDTDWLDEVLRTAPIYSMTGSVAGGTDKARYFVSGTAFGQEGIVKGFGYDRLSGRLNLDYAVSDKLALGTNVALTRSVTQRSRGDNTIYGPFANAIANPSIYPVYNPDGSYSTPLYANPVGLAKENEAEERSLRVLGNAFASYEALPGVTVRASVGLDQLSLRSRLYDSPIVGVAVGSSGAGRVGNAFVTKVTYEGTVNWLRDFADVHTFSGVVGTSYEKNTTERSSVIGSNFPTSYFRYLTSAAQITDGSSSLTSWALMSFFSRLSYTYGDRYTATFNIRTDGSSRFGEDNRYGVFPSASLLWRVSEESFMEDNPIFSNLAVRASYGRTGNQHGIGNFAALGLVESGSNYDDQPGLSPAQLANPELKWETTDQLNVGADFSVLDDRLAFSVDYYVKKTNDLLLNRPVPATTGFTTLTSNIGAMENRGVELAARAQLARGGADGFNWTVDFNIATNKNEVTALYNDEPIMSGFNSRVEVGQPLGFFYGYVMDGIFRDQDAVDAHGAQPGAEPGDVRFKDINGDGRITADDRTKIGSPWPDYVGGLTNTMSYKGFDLTVFLQYSIGNDIFNAGRIYSEAYGSYFDNHTKRALKRWTPENPDATEPRAVYGDPNGNTRISSRFVEDGSYLRVKNAVLGYTVPSSIAGKMGFSSLRVYVQAQNLFTFTDYSGFDPEVNYAGDTSVTRGVDFYTLPQPRTITAGFNIGF